MRRWRTFFHIWTGFLLLDRWTWLRCVVVIVADLLSVGVMSGRYRWLCSIIPLAPLRVVASALHTKLFQSPWNSNFILGLNSALFYHLWYSISNSSSGRLTASSYHESSLVEIMRCLLLKLLSLWLLIWIWGMMKSRSISIKRELNMIMVMEYFNLSYFRLLHCSSYSSISSFLISWISI